jgi:hypothetical protein
MNSFITYRYMNEHLNDMRRQAAEARRLRELRPTRERRRFVLHVLRSGRRAPKPLGTPVAGGC